MNDFASDRVSPMQSPPHLGKFSRESMGDVGWNVIEAARLRMWNAVAAAEQQDGSVREYFAGAGGHRLGTAENWLRMQASYALAQARRHRDVVERRAGALHA